jgi:hypothetical protein
MAESPEATKVAYQYVARTSIAFFMMPAHDSPDRPDLNDVYDAVVQWLDKDSRVKSFEPIPSDDNVVRETVFAMARGVVEEAADDVAHSPHGHVHVGQFERPIEFKMNVAVRHQDQQFGPEAIPSEDYFVSWDGIQLLVAWPAGKEGQDTGAAGGLSAFDLLHEAMESVGLQLLVEPCGPYCDYPFAHRDLLIAQDETIAELSVTDHKRSSVLVALRPDKEPLRMVSRLAHRLAPTTRAYARMRSYGATINATNASSRRDVSRLLRLQYDLAHAASLGGRTGIGERWANRGKPNKMALITASLWLELATIEENRRRWIGAKAAFDSAGRYGEQAIFSIEYAEEVETVERVDVEDLRSVADRMSQRADSRTVGVATIGGAIAGGTVGGLIAFLATVASSSGA